MQCNCRSKQLYSISSSSSSSQSHSQPSTFKIDNKTHQLTRSITPQYLPAYSQQLLSQIFQTSQLYIHTKIDRIYMQQIYASPLWFYKYYISANKPCIIQGAIQGNIIEKWADPQKFMQICQNMYNVSISVTPDGFADSIKGQYFVQPVEIKGNIKDVIQWKQKQQQNGVIKPEWVPYIQHQNSNLTEQCPQLIKYIDQDMKNFMSLHYFQGNEPDASNFWLGYQDSVSSLHKDPYQNFYTTMSGQKHFTLLPPISIAYLHEQQYKTSKYTINSQSQSLQITTNKQPQQQHQSYSTTRWISCNPDLKSDHNLFPELPLLHDYQHHIILQAGQTLYLPSLWYHQVAQTHNQNKGYQYTAAVNYWFDMGFGSGYGMYQTVRKIKGYP